MISMEEKHIAFKCTYNNGNVGIIVGFNGTCSEDIIKRNIESGRIWCSQKDCECRKYYDSGFKGKQPKGNLCYESVLFKDWRYGAGWYHTGRRAGTPMHLPDVGLGKIAILTTLFPGDRDIDRRIIGLFRIGEITNDPETIVKADDKYRIRLPLEEARELFFWDYYTKKQPWGSHLHRYLDDIQVAQILKAIQETVKDENVRHLINELLEEISKKIPSKKIPNPSGPRIKISGKRTKRISIKRKYGAGGEGEEHKRLKEWVAKNPEFLGLKNIIKTEVEEHIFPSGDLPDVVFSCRNGKYAVIEVETDYPLPGAYQSIKYKSLLCAELGLPLGSSDVETILVAWSLPPDLRGFCEKYNIKYVKKKL